MAGAIYKYDPLWSGGCEALSSPPFRIKAGIVSPVAEKVAGRQPSTLSPVQEWSWLKRAGQ